MHVGRLDYLAHSLVAPAFLNHKGRNNPDSLTAFFKAAVGTLSHESHVACTVYQRHALLGHQLTEQACIAEITLFYLCAAGTIDSNLLI